MTYEEWEEAVPLAIKADAVWRVKAYRLSLFLSDLAWADAGRLLRDKRATSMADQLVRAAGKIGACITEGYSRGTGRDRARFYEYALGSLREVRDWYYKGRHMMTTSILDHRMQLLEEMLKLVLTMISRDRKRERIFEASE